MGGQGLQAERPLCRVLAWGSGAWQGSLPSVMTVGRDVAG